MFCFVFFSREMLTEATRRNLKTATKSRIARVSNSKNVLRFTHSCYQSERETVIGVQLHFTKRKKLALH